MIEDAVLAALANAGIPVVSVTFPNRGDRRTWVITFDPSATPDQRTAAQALVAAFDPTAPNTVDLVKARAAQAVLTPALRVFYLFAHEKFLGKLPTDAERAADLARMVELFKQFG